ncbi:MAG: TldD/PmbA family protein, partial [Defluviitaleaceae bacterium]|nr:TldD/PmbA family protein [Defluviitaleaceae bacterium]
KENEDEFLYTGDDSYEKVPGISPNIFKPSVEQKIEWAKEMESYAKSLDSRVISIDSCVVSNSSSKGSLVNSYGLDLSSESGQAFCYIYVRVKQKEEVKTGVKIFASRDFEDFDPKKLAKEAVEIALSKLGAILPKSDKYNVIIENKAFINLFSVFSSNFYAENIQRGVSLLKGKLGEKVASEKLTIKDDYKHNKSIQAKAFDSEGVKTKNKIVVENGVLKTFLYNLKSAKKDGVKPTGNGTRGGTGVVNFYIEPSKNSLNYLFEKMQNGIIITSFAGLHAGTNSISGEFSLQAEGFIIEAGEKSRPIQNFVVSGNFYKMLNNIEELADDIYFGGGSLGSPSIWVKELIIAGE